MTVNSITQKPNLKFQKYDDQKENIRTKEVYSLPLIGLVLTFSLFIFFLC